ncbi:MAG: serine protease, partial [Verrucomicrobia bacterium]|nr:serine protease [Verrucomicrobiota bacterium]
VLVSLLCLSFAGRADELADKGRAVFNKHQRAVVTVQVVQKMTFSTGGRTSEPNEMKQDITGTVMDPSGLIVLALSAVDVGEMYKRMSPNYKVETEVSDVKILLDDGAEIPAEIVLRDKDLDLAFIRAKSKPASPMATVDFGKASKVDVLDQIVTLNRLGRAAGRAYSASVERISAVVHKPRTFYIPDSGMTGTALGSPAFALDGNIVGILVMRSISSGSGGSMNNFRPDNMTSIILPAEDVVKAAKQAPEAKDGDEKNSDKKEEAKEQK